MKNLEFSFSVSLVLAFVISMVACSSYDLGDKPPVSVAVNTSNPTWENGIQELVAIKCDNCHSKAPSSNVPGEIRDDPARYQLGLSETEEIFLSHGLSSYNRVFDDAANPMPPNYGTPLTSDENAALKLYLENRVINVTEDRQALVATACASVAANTLTFSADVSSTYTSSCAACHTGAAGVGKLDLGSAALWKENRTDLIYVLVTPTAARQMPPGRASNYTAEGQTGHVFLRYLCGSAEVN